MMTPEQEAAINLFYQSEAARKRGDKPAAKALLHSSIGQDASLPGAWYNLATDAQSEKRHLQAVAQLRRADELSPNNPQCLTNLGISLQWLGRHHEAVEALVKAVDAAPELSLGWASLSQAYSSLHAAEHAISAGRKAVELDGTDPQYHMALAFALLMDGQWSEGLREYEWRIPYKNMDFAIYPMPKWDGLPAETLFIPAEQGFGDVLQFGRFIKAAAERAQRTIVCVQADLMGLLSSSIRTDSVIELIPMPCILPKSDAFCPMMSLPVALGLSDTEIETCESSWFEFKKGIKERPLNAPYRKKVGIVWAGSLDQDNDHHRSATVDDFIELYAAPGIQLYSLQVGDRARECRPHGPLVIDLSPKIRYFSDTAELICQMDSVVTVCTATAHLAGSLGVETHIVLPKHGQHFVWGHSGSKTPWYPSVTLHRQTRMGYWLDVMQQVARKL